MRFLIRKPKLKPCFKKRATRYLSNIIVSQLDLNARIDIPMGGQSSFLIAKSGGPASLRGLATHFIWLRSKTKAMFKLIRFWVALNVAVPVVRKPLNVRMGKGRGNIAGYRANVTPGTHLVNITGARPGLVLWAREHLQARTQFGISAFVNPVSSEGGYRRIANSWTRRLWRLYVELWQQKKKTFKFKKFAYFKAHEARLFRLPSLKTKFIPYKIRSRNQIKSSLIPFNVIRGTSRLNFVRYLPHKYLWNNRQFRKAEIENAGLRPLLFVNFIFHIRVTIHLMNIFRHAKRLDEQNMFLPLIYWIQKRQQLINPKEISAYQSSVAMQELELQKFGYFYKHVKNYNEIEDLYDMDMIWTQLFFSKY